MRRGSRVWRRYTFLALLLLTLVAPAGFVMAGQRSAPYVVLFDPAVVGAPASDPGPSDTAGRAAFRQLASSAAVRAAGRAGTGGTTSLVRTTGVDAQRVVNHVRQIAARSRVRVNALYRNAVGGFAADLTPAQLRVVSNDPAVAAVLPDVAVQIDDGSVGKTAGVLRGVNNPAWQIPAGVRRIGARSPLITKFTRRETQINADVAIIDTGIERDHPDLNVVGGYNCTGRNKDKWDDKAGHGTHVAGIVGARDNSVGVVGVAPGVRLWAVKALDGEGHGLMSWIVCGIDWVTAQRDPRNPARPLFEVANMSISFSLSKPNDADCGVPAHDVIHQAICRSVAAGTVYVAAAGNNSRNARRNRPASYDEVITVSAMADYDGRGGGLGRSSNSCPYRSPEPDDSFADFSNYGPDVDLIAPGRCILSTYLGRRYAWMSGTSMATPHVTGAAALYRAMHPRTTPLQVRLALQAVGTLDWRVGTDPDSDPGAHEKAVWIGAFRHVPDFSVSAAAVVDPVAAGGQLALGLRVRRVGGFYVPITVSLEDAPAGFAAERVVVERKAGTLSVDVARRTRRGTYQLTVVAQAGDVVHRTTFEITVRRRAR
jgi:subtilisin family serine protease